ncbi:MAG: hypothetical protein ACRYFS_19860 [Janthinobacterium lividum]
MATVTEMTLALGRTVYGGDQSGEEGSDEKIEGRETRLSVTWRLTEEEQDLTLMASILGEEAARALKQADRTVQRRPNPEAGCDEKSYDTEKGYDTQAVPRLNSEPNSSEPKSAENGNGHTPEPSHQQVSNQPVRTYPPAGSGQAAPDQNGSKIPATNGASVHNSSSGRSGASGYPAYVPPITKTQQMAIQSHCTRHGVADWELRKLLWERFGKKEQRELSKDEAGELLAALQQAILHNGADHSSYAN